MKKHIVLLVVVTFGLCGVVIMEAATRAMQPCVAGMVGDYPCLNIDLLSQVTLSELGGGSGADLWGWTDPMSGKEYALMTRSTGTTFVDVSDPVTPVIIGRLPSATGAKVQRDVKVLGEYALIVSEASGHGMQVFDLTQLRGVTETTVFSADYHYTATTQVHNVVVNETNPTYAVLVGSSQGTTCNGGLHLLNMTQPITPTFAGCFSADGYTHDAQCITYDGPDQDYTGRELCFAANTDTLTIVDITDPANMTQISRTTYPGVGYTHQGWLTEDRHYFLLNDEVDELNNGHNTRTYVMDVVDLDAPKYHMTHEFATISADHNLYVNGNYAYLANYNSGLRILYIEDIAAKNLHEVAYFDIYLGNDATPWQGAWSVYPYFESGNLIVSGQEGGLFVLKANLATLSIDLSQQGATTDYQTRLLVTLIVVVAPTLLLFRRRK